VAESRGVGTYEGLWVHARCCIDFQQLHIY